MAISIYSPNWDDYDSYGIIANRLADWLSLERPVNRLGLDNVPYGQITPSYGGLLLGYPTLYERFGPLAAAGARVAVTMFESTVLPDGWVENLNTCDAVVVPSTWVRDIFRTNGVTVPLHVIPLGVDWVYKLVERPPRNGRPYTFICLGDRATRKGWDLAWHAFRQAFGSRDDVKLIIKCREGGLDRIRSADGNVEILRADLTQEEMAQLYAECDCMVFPTRGEGFGLPPREFAATGAPVLVTGFSGTADDLPFWGTAIPYDMTDAWPEAHHYDAKLVGRGEWAEPNVDALAAMMGAQVDAEGLWQAIAQARRSNVAELYDWGDFGERVHGVYREVCNPSPGPSPYMERGEKVVEERDDN